MDHEALPRRAVKAENQQASLILLLRISRPMLFGDDLLYFRPDLLVAAGWRLQSVYFE